MKEHLLSFAAAIAVVSLVFAGCSKTESAENEVSEDFISLDEIVCTRNITVNRMTKSGDTQPVDLTLTATYSIDDNSMTSVIFTSTDSEIDTELLMSEVCKKFEEVNGFPLMNFDFSKIATTKGSDNPTADCLNDCSETKEKGEGRGWCRAGCIVDAVVRVVQVVLDAVSGIFS